VAGYGRGVPAALSPERGLLAFAGSVFVFHQLPTFAGDRGGAALDLLTPFAVIGSAAAVLFALGARGGVLVFALVAGILYVDGHGMHLSANSIANEDPVGGVEETVHFWDEEFSHVEAVLGWFGLVASFCLAEARRPGRAAASETRSSRVLAVAAVVLGWTFFTSTVEGGTWWLALAATAVFVIWAVRARRPLLTSAAAAYALAALLIGIWAIWQGGVPQFTEAGLI
jgi:hypothetical protein